MSDHEPENLARALRTIDLLATSLIEKSKPLRFSVAQSTAERESAFRLRAQALIDRGGAKPVDFPDGLERDEHDDRAFQVIGWNGDQIVATGRGVPPAPEYLLPTEQAFGLTIEPRGKVIDIGRFSVSHDFTQSDNRYFVGLLGFCWLEARVRGYFQVCGTASPGMLRHYRRIGFIVTVLAPPHVYYGEERFPCWYDVVGAAEALIAKWGAPVKSSKHV